MRACVRACTRTPSLSPPPARRPFARAAIARETTGPPEQMESATTPVQRACNSAAVCTPTRRSDEPGAAGAAPEPRVSGRGRHRRRPGHRHAGPRPCRAVCAWANSPPSSADCCPRFAKQPLAFLEFFSVGRARCCFLNRTPPKRPRVLTCLQSDDGCVAVRGGGPRQISASLRAVQDGARRLGATLSSILSAVSPRSARIVL